MFTGNDKEDEIQCKVEDIAGLNHVAKSSLSFSKTENDKSAFHYGSHGGTIPDYVFIYQCHPPQWSRLFWDRICTLWKICVE